MVVARGHPHQPRRQDLARGRRRPRHGPHLRLRRRGARRRPARTAGSPCAAARPLRRGRRHLDRRHHRRGLRRRRAGGGLLGGALLRGRGRRDDPIVAAVAAADGARGRRPPAAGARQRRHRRRTPRRARRFGAQGIGLCRTEHMFLGERRQLVENLDRRRGRGRTRRRALAELLPLQRQDFTEILEAMDGLPVTIRLIDPPLHEFLPDFTELSVAGGARGRRAATARQPARASCSRRSAGCTSRTRCSACAGSGSASSSPGCSRCRPGRSSRPPRTGSRPAATRGRRS